MPYLLIGASIGAFIHEVIPTDFPENFAGKNQLSSMFKRKMIAAFVTCVFNVAIVT